MSSELNIKKEGESSVENKSSQNLSKEFSFDGNNDNKKEAEPVRRRSTRVRRSVIPEQTMKQFLAITGSYNMKNLSKNQSEILNQFYEEEPVFVEDTLISNKLNNEEINEISNAENKIEMDDNKIKHKDNNKHNKHKEVKSHDQKTLNDYNIEIINNKSNKPIEKEPHNRRSTRIRHSVIPENTLRGYLEITGDFDNIFNQQQSQILEQYDEQSSLSTYISESNNIEIGDVKLNQEKKINNNDKSNTNENNNKSDNNKDDNNENRMDLPNDNKKNENKEELSVEKSSNSEKLKRESGSDSEEEFHQRRSKRIRHSVIPDSTLKEYLKLTSELNVKHHQRGKHKKHDANDLNLSSDDLEDIEKEKIRLENRRRREKKIQERFYNYDFEGNAYQDENFADDKPTENQEHHTNTQEKKKNSISDYYKLESETGKDNILKMEDKIEKEYENVKIDNSKNEVSIRVKNKIKSLKKRMSKKEEKQHSFNSIDSMFMRNNEKTNSFDNMKSSEENVKEKTEKIFPIFNKRKSSISTENEVSNSQPVNDTDSKSNETKEKEKSSIGINEAQPLSIIDTDSFFLTSKQKQWKMQKLNQQKLRKDLEESYKFHSSFAQGKAIHTFFQLARSSSRQNSGASLASTDSSLNVSKSFSENIEYPTTFMEAAYPTSWNNHVYNDNTAIDTNENVHSPEESNDILNKQDSMNICLSPSRTSSTVDLEGNIYGINDSQNNEESSEEIDEEQSSYIDVDGSSNNDDSSNDDSDSEDDNNNSLLDTQESQSSLLNEQTSTGINMLENIQDTNLLSSPHPIESSSSIEPSIDDDESNSDVSMLSESDSDNGSITSDSTISFNQYKFNKRHPQTDFIFDSEDMNEFLISIINDKELIQEGLFERMNKISRNKVNNSNDVTLRFLNVTSSQIDFNKFLSILFPTNKTTTPWNHLKDFAYSNDLLRKYINSRISPNKIENYPKYMDFIYSDAIWTEKYSPQSSSQVLSNKSQADEIISWLNNWKIGKTEGPTVSNEPEVVEVTSSKRGRKKHNNDSTYHPEDDDFMGYYDYNYVNYYENLFSTPTVETKGDKFLFLVGPPASGKSSTIQACALECGFEILEIYPGIKRSGKDITNIIGDLTQSHIVMSMEKSLHSPKRKGSASFPTSANLLDSNKVTSENSTSTNQKAEQGSDQKNPLIEEKIQSVDHQNIDTTEATDIAGNDEVKDDEAKKPNSKKDVPKETVVKKRGRPKKTAITEADTQKNLINNYFGKKKRKMSDDITNNSKKESEKVINNHELSSSLNEDKKKDEDIIEIEDDKSQESKTTEKEGKIDKSQESKATEKNDNEMQVDNVSNTITIDDSGRDKDNKKSNNKPSNKNKNKHSSKINKIQTDNSKMTLSSSNKNNISSPTSPQNLTNLLIVFEEVDILMDQDKGFWASVYNIIKSTKRPIMFTGNENILRNELMQIPPNLYLSLSIQDYDMPKIEDVVIYVFYLCLLEEHLIDPRDIISLCQLYNNDIRKIINQLQFRLLKMKKDTKKIQSTQDEKEKSKKNDKVIVIDLDDDDDNTKGNENVQKNDQSSEVKDEALLEKSFDNLKIQQEKDQSTIDTVMSPTTKEIVMEHLSLDQIIGIDLNLVNVYNYYLRHHIRPDLALVRTIPNYVLLPKYDQMQYHFEEIYKEENELYYSSLNKLYEAEVQQLTDLNNNYGIDIFDEWCIHDRGGVLTWIIQYKKRSRKTNKNENNNNTINDLLSPSSSVMSSPGLKPLTDFTSKSPTSLTSSKKKVAIMDYFISDKKEKKNDFNNNHDDNKPLEGSTIENQILQNNQSDTNLENTNSDNTTQKMNTDSTTLVDLTISSPLSKPTQPILVQDKEEDNTISEFPPTIQNSGCTGKVLKEKDYQDLLLLRALSDYEATISETDALISMTEDRRFQLFEIDSYGPCKDDCIGYSSICKENIKRDSPQFCVSNTNYEETLNNYIGSENHLCAWVNTLAKHHLYSEVENICHSEQLSKLYTSSPLATQDLVIPGTEQGTTFGEMFSGLETPNKDSSMMSTSPFSNDITSSSVVTEGIQDPNQSILSNYLDTQMMQTLQINNEIISVATPTPLPVATTSELPSLVSLENSKESYLDPISVSTPPPLPNLPSSIPITTETVIENEIKIPPPITNFISSQPFSYKHKNKGKFKSKKIFDTISKKTCYWPTWIEEKSQETYNNYCKALEYTLYHSQCAVCKNTLVIDHIPYIEKMLEIENASLESSIKCNGRKRRSASGRISKIYRHLAEIDESQVNMLIDWNMVNKFFNENDFHHYKSSYKTLVSNLEKALQFISH